MTRNILEVATDLAYLDITFLSGIFIMVGIFFFYIKLLGGGFEAWLPLVITSFTIYALVYIVPNTAPYFALIHIIAYWSTLICLKNIVDSRAGKY